MSPSVYVLVFALAVAGCDTMVVDESEEGDFLDEEGLDEEDVDQTTRNADSLRHCACGGYEYHWPNGDPNNWVRNYYGEWTNEWNFARCAEWCHANFINFTRSVCSTAEYYTGLQYTTNMLFRARYVQSDRDYVRDFNLTYQCGEF